MVYAIQSDNEHIDTNYIKHIGYSDYENPYIKHYFSKENVDRISKKITSLLEGVDSKNRSIIVSDENIVNVLNNVYTTYTPPIGDIHSRHIISSGINTEQYIDNMINQTIDYITQDVKNNKMMEESNKNISIWSTLYGDFNPYGLQQYSSIKIKNKHPDHCQFHMRY